MTGTTLLKRLPLILKNKLDLTLLKLSKPNRKGPGREKFCWSTLTVKKQLKKMQKLEVS